MPIKPLLLIICATLTSLSSATLLFSEYIEGSNYNRALEIYNAGATDIDQSKVTIEGYFNGSITPHTFTLSSGTLTLGSVWVVINSYSTVTQPLKDKANQFEGDVLMMLWY